MRHIARFRRRAQGFVEYGLATAAVAFVALVGFTALGNAQATYWGAAAPQFAPPPPSGGQPLHSTGITVDTTNCDPAATYHTGDTVMCKATVKDLSQTSPVSPPGEVSWKVDNTASGTCSLTPVPGTVTSTCTFSYLWTSPGIPHVVAAQYTGSGNLQQSPTVDVSLTVPPYDFLFSCRDPWQVGWTFQVQVSRPLFCNLIVQDSLGHAAPDGLSVQVDTSAVTGVASLACFTDDDPQNPSLHAAAYARMSAAGCAPIRGQQASYSCSIVPLSRGLCANNYSSATSTYLSYCPQPTCSFVYRRNYDDSGAYSSSDQLTAATAYESGSSPTINIVPASTSAATATVIECVSNVSATTDMVIRAGMVNSDVGLSASTHTPLNVACAASVIDIGLNTAFDYPSCGPPVDLHCDIDAQQAHSPYGTVTITVSDAVSSTVLHTYTCTLAHIPPPPNYVRWLHPFHAWFDASWCNTYRDEMGTLTSQLNFPVGNWTVNVAYGGSLYHAPTGASSGPPFATMTVDVT